MKISRSGFISSSALALASSRVSGCATRSFERPPRLRVGDAVGLVSLGSPLLSVESAKTAAEQLAQIGLVTRFGNHLFERFGYLAGTDEARAADFNSFARNPNIRAIFGMRGGYGALRTLPLLDFGAIQNDPKVIIGFSDMTSLLNAVTATTGIITMHGTMPPFDDFSVLEQLNGALIKGSFVTAYTAQRAQVIVPGVARGRLFGGNLSVFVSLMGTPFEPTIPQPLYFFEEVDELPRKVDRNITQLYLAERLGHAAGTIFGECLNCMDKKSSLPWTYSVRGQLGQAARPSILGAPIGHDIDQWLLPIGLEATLYADDNATLLFDSRFVE